MAANEYPERVVTLEDVADAVDQAFQEASRALMDELDGEGTDEQTEHASWWQGYPEGHPYDTRWGIPIGDHPLPRVSSTSSWWDQ